MKKYIFIIIMCLVLVPQVSMAETPAPADDSYTLIEPLPCITGVTKDCDAGGVTKKIDIKSYILYVYKFAIAISVFLAIIMIIWGGFSYITSEVPFIKTEAKGKIEGAVSGLALVLVSYLILVTIDPRLVNIETEIPAINMKNLSVDSVGSYNKYQEGLSNDLKRISNENQAAYMKEKSEIDKIRKEMSDLQGQVNRGELKGDNLAKAIQNIEKKRIEVQNRAVQQQTKLAEYTALFQYSTALHVLNNPEAGSTINDYTEGLIPNKVDEKGFLPENSSNAIQSTFNKRINDIKRLGTADEDSVITNFNEIQALGKQRDFFISEIKKDVETNKIINGHGASMPGTGEDIIIANNTDSLNNLLQQTKAELVDEKKMEDSGLPKEQYTKIKEARIESLNKALGNPVAEPPVETPPKP